MINICYSILYSKLHLRIILENDSVLENLVHHRQFLRINTIYLSTYGEQNQKLRETCVYLIQTCVHLIQTRVLYHTLWFEPLTSSLESITPIKALLQNCMQGEDYAQLIISSLEVCILPTYW